MTTLEKQVQSLTTAVERLTKQNQVLEEQLRWKIGHDILEEDLEDTSAERRDWEGPKGTNTPSRLERQPPVPYGCNSIPYCRGDTGNKGTYGGNDEHFQGTSV